MKTDDFLTRFGSARASAILRTANAGAAAQAMSAAILGGFRIIEFTLTTPGALDLISEFRRRPELTVGAGTVLTTDDANRAVAAGAQFLVSPVTDEKVITEAERLEVPIVPGAATPSEMLRAHRAGAPLQKLFPEVATGPLWIKQVLGPMPFLRIVPTSGINCENALAYLQAGAFAVGFVNSLFDPTEIASGRFDLITARARSMVAAISSFAGKGKVAEAG